MQPTVQVAGNPLKQILNTGQSIWYDGLISVKEFERMIREDGLRGATTNPTIFEKALSSGEYDAEIQRLAGAHDDAEIFKVLAVRAVQGVCDAFRAVYEETRGEDGFVSLEVSPLLARDTRGTIAEAEELWQRVGRKNVMIKIPATREGLPAIEAAIAQGLNVNVTLIFSVQRYREVVEAYLKGLEKRISKDLPVERIASVASFFVSRVDTAADKLLENKDKSLMGQIGVANSKAAYREFEIIFGGVRFQKLKQKGAAVQRPLWASTGTKNASYSDVMYVEALMGPHTVNTAPPATLDAFRDHGKPASRLQDKCTEALQILESLKPKGIDLETLTQKLEEDGVKLFADSYNKIIQLIHSKRK